ncbi:MAG: response regulator [Azospirillum sp.]|nr:response regulator [Azospirillum sp.]
MVDSSLATRVVKPHRTTAAIRILIANSDAAVAQAIAETLRSMGHDVCDIAGTTAEALAITARSRPDLVLMAVRLNDGDGIEAARRLNAERGLRSLFLAAATDHQTMSRITASYPLGIVRTPYSAQQLRTALDLAMIRLPARAVAPLQ